MGRRRWWIGALAAALVGLVAAPLPSGAHPREGPVVRAPGPTGAGSSLPLPRPYPPAAPRGAQRPPPPAPGPVVTPTPTSPAPQSAPGEAPETYTLPGPAVPAPGPAPGRWRVPRRDSGQADGGPAPAPPCDWYLAGPWEAESAGSPPPERGRLTFRQFGSYLVGVSLDETLIYYGRCSGDVVDLEVWAGWEFIGRQVGRVALDGQSITLVWVQGSPERTAARETLSGRARRLR